MSHRLTRRTWAALGILLVVIPALMAVFVCVWDERKYYLTSLLLVGLMFVPFVLRFEGRRPQARELVLLATMTALAVAGRAAFYWLPQCKPVCAIVILTAVEKVAINYNKPNQQELSTLTVAEAELYIKEGHFAPGSMLPKVMAAIKFARRFPGKKAIITSLYKAVEALEGKEGTVITMA